MSRADGSAEQIDCLGQARFESVAPPLRLPLQEEDRQIAADRRRKQRERQEPGQDEQRGTQPDPETGAHQQQPLDARGGAGPLQQNSEIADARSAGRQLPHPRGLVLLPPQDGTGFDPVQCTDVLELLQHTPAPPRLLEELDQQGEADGTERDRQEDQDGRYQGAVRDVHQRSRPRPSRLRKSSADRSTPYALSRSVNLGRIPVAAKRPMTRSSSAMPCRSNV